MCRKVIRVVLVLMFTITTFLFAAFPAFADSLPNANAFPSLHSAPPQSTGPDQCLITALQVNIDSSQEFTAIGHVTNACGVTVNVSSIRINAQTTDCPPFPTNNSTFSV